MSDHGIPGGVVIGSDFQSLGVVRSLRERSVPVFLVEYERGIARYSRFVRRVAAKHDLFSNGDGVQFLLDLASKEQRDAECSPRHVAAQTVDVYRCAIQDRNGAKRHHALSRDRHRHSRHSGQEKRALNTP